MQRIAIREYGHWVGEYAAPALLGVLGVVLVLLCTSRYGVGLSPDSANYVAAARSLPAGQGYRYFEGGVYTQWPPLFPTLLAIPGLIGVEPQVAARWLNAFAFGGIVFCAGLLFGRCMTSPAAAVLGTLSVLLSTPLLAASSMLWSEPVFVLLAVLFVLCVPRFMRTKSWGTLLLLSTLVGLACLQRYAGVTLIATGGIVIALGMPKVGIGARLKYSAGFCLLSGIPLALWFVRNQAVAAQTIGSHQLSLGRIGEMGRPLVAAGDLIAAWFSSRGLPRSYNILGVGVVLLLAAALAVFSHWRLEQPKHRSGIAIWSAGLFFLIYVGFIGLSGAGLNWDPEQRIMTPPYLFAMVFLFAGFEDAFRLLAKRFGGTNLLQSVCLILMGVWLLYPLTRASETVRFALADGAGGYGSRLWQESPLIEWLRVNRLEGAVYSNVADAVYLLTGIAAKETPHFYWDAREFAAKMPAGLSRYVVWLHSLRRDHVYDLRELASRWRLEPVVELADGEVYRFLGVRDDPGVVAVYRFWSPERRRHLYLLDKWLRNGSNAQRMPGWIGEGCVFHVYPVDGRPTGALPVYQLWSEAMQTSLYTIDQAERDLLLAKRPDDWQDRGIAWYAFGEDEHPPDACPVYRFWSGSLQTHFYTIDKAERDRLVASYAHVWTYEGIVWYAYGQ